MLPSLPETDHLAQRLGGVGDDAEIDAHDLVDLGGIDIEMDLLRARREGADPAGDSGRRSARPDRSSGRNHAWRDWLPRYRACPACPAIRGREAGKAPSPIKVEVMGKPVKSTSSRSSLRGFRAGIDDAAAGIEDRPLGRRPSSPPRLTMAAGVGIGLGPVGAVMDRLRPHDRRRSGTARPWGCPPPPDRDGRWWRSGMPHAGCATARSRPSPANCAWCRAG